MSHIWAFLPWIPVVVAVVGTGLHGVHPAFFTLVWHAAALHASGVTFVVAAVVEDPRSSF